MDEKWASITALITAYCRGYHATHDSPKIFDDFLAADLFTVEEHLALDQQLAGQLKIINPEQAAANPDQATALACVMQTHNGPITLSRSRYTEDQLITAIASASPTHSVGHDVDQGVQQYVILGVTYYLTREVVLDTLRDVAAVAPPGSVIVFDYMDADAFNSERAAKRMQLMQAIARQVGEPMQAGFDPAELAAELNRAGFQLEEDLDPAAIENRYFQHRSDEYHAFEHVHFARAVVPQR
jgi:O-methyltransferase involved in polyketide biosynthesis